MEPTMTETRGDRQGAGQIRGVKKAISADSVGTQIILLKPSSLGNARVFSDPKSHRHQETD